MNRTDVHPIKRCHAIQLFSLACAAFLAAASPCSLAQVPSGNPAASQGEVEASGRVVVPPVTDPGMTRQAPVIGDPQAVKPPPMPIDPEDVRTLPPEKGGTLNKSPAKPEDEGYPVPKRSP